MFTRFRALPEDQLQRILRYVESGKPIVGLRTSTHAFLYPDGHPRQALNDGFGRDVFGQKWITHHGSQSSTDVAVHAANAAHPDAARRRAVSRAVVALSRRAAQRRGDRPAGRHLDQLEQDGQAGRVSADPAGGVDAAVQGSRASSSRRLDTPRTSRRSRCGAW